MIGILLRPPETRIDTGFSFSLSGGNAMIESFRKWSTGLPWASRKQPRNSPTAPSFKHRVQVILDDADMGQRGFLDQRAAGDHADIGDFRSGQHIRQFIVEKQRVAAFRIGAVDRCREIVAFDGQRPGERRGDLEGVGARTAGHTAHQADDPALRLRLRSQRAHGKAQGAAGADADAHVVLVDQPAGHGACRLADHPLLLDEIIEIGDDHRFDQPVARRHCLRHFHAIAQRQRDADLDMAGVAHRADDLVDLQARNVHLLCDVLLGASSDKVEPGNASLLQFLVKRLPKFGHGISLLVTIAE